MSSSLLLKQCSACLVCLIWIVFVKGGKWPYICCFVVEACWLSQAQEGQKEQTHPQTFDDPFFDSTGMIYMHWVPTGQTVNKEYYVEVLREFRKRFPGRGQHSSNRVIGIFTRTIHQYTTPSLSQTIWPRWASGQFLTLPIVETLLPVTFGYSLSSEAVVMRQLRRWERLWRSSRKRTSIGPSRSCWNGRTSALQPEEITSKGTRVSCVYYQ